MTLIKREELSSRFRSLGVQLTDSYTDQSSMSFSELDQLIASEFKVRESYLYVGIPVFLLEKDQDFETGIRRIRDKLETSNLIPVLRREQDQIILRIHGRRPATAEPSRKWLQKLPLVLFFVTIASVTFSGYLTSAAYLHLLTVLGRLQYNEQTFMLVSVSLYTISLMSVVGLHEFGHILSCWKHKVKASLPYFIPGLPPFGTFGAVIRQESPVLNKNELFDLGLSGPAAGFLVSIVISCLGLSSSVLVSSQELSVVSQNMPSISIGAPISWLVIDSLLFKSQLFLGRSPNSEIFISPMAFAGWAGFLVTFLNAFPVGQLDGGHVSFAVFGPKYHTYISYAAAIVMTLMGFWPMALLSILTLRAGAPMILDDVTKLDTKRKIAALLLPVLLVFSSSLL